MWCSASSADGRGIPRVHPMAMVFTMTATGGDTGVRTSSFTPAGQISQKNFHAIRRTAAATRALILFSTLSLSALAQQQPAPTSQTPLPNAPSSTAQGQQSSWKHGLATAVRIIGDDEWHMIKAPFEMQALGFDYGTPLRNTTLYWNAAVLTGTGILIANDEVRRHQVIPTVGTNPARTSPTDSPTPPQLPLAASISPDSFTHDEHAQRTGVLSAEAASIASALRRHEAYLQSRTPVHRLWRRQILCRQL